MPSPDLDQLLTPDNARTVLLVIGAAVARVAGALWAVPFGGGRWVPVTVRLGLSAALALTLAPLLMTDALQRPPPSTSLLLLLLAKEALLGLALGLIMAIIFWGVESAGRLMDTSLGAQGAGPAETWPLARLMPLMAAALFLMLGGHRLYILALARSFEVIPPWTIPGGEGLAGLATLFLSLGGELFLLALLLAAPLIGCLLLADLAMAWISRPPANARLMVILQPARALLGVGLMLATVAVLSQVVPRLLEEALGQVELATDLLGRSGVR